MMIMYFTVALHPFRALSPLGRSAPRLLDTPLRTISSNPASWSRVIGVVIARRCSMPTLVLSPRYTDDSKALRAAAGRAGWKTERLGGWRAPRPPARPGRRPLRRTHVRRGDRCTARPGAHRRPPGLAAALARTTPAPCGERVDAR